MRMRILLYTFCLFALLSCDSSTPETENSEFPSLKEAAPFPIGVAIKSSHTSSSQRGELIGYVFDSITAEYEMKMDATYPSSNSFNWNGSDAIVNFANNKNSQVHGHALVWYQSMPSWVNSFTGTDAEFEAKVQDYIETAMQRYSGKTVSWDVINEAFEDGGTGNLRQYAFRERMGDDYIAKLFQMARAADPTALLFYNDYGMTYDSVKRQAMLDMVADFQSRGIPIDGIGLQMHLTTNTNNQQISDLITQVAATGLKVHLSEIDIRINEDGSLNSPTGARLEQQNQKLVSMVNVFRSIPLDQQFAITFWGLSDPDSWLINFWGNPEWGLLFDQNFRPKPVYCGFYAALGGTETCTAG